MCVGECVHLVCAIVYVYVCVYVCVCVRVWPPSLTARTLLLCRGCTRPLRWPPPLVVPLAPLRGRGGGAISRPRSRLGPTAA
jgi:hypothetical protein